MGRFMITFIWIFAAVVLATAAYFVAKGAGQRRRSGQSGQAIAQSQEDGGGAPKAGRATGLN